MPLRDDRRGRRATISFGTTPFRPEFHASSATDAPTAGATQTPSESAAIVQSDDATAAAAPAPLPASLPVAASSSLPASQPAVLDPFAFLTALAQPLYAARDACVRFVSGTSAPTASLEAESPDADPDAKAGTSADALAQIEREASVIERSFASEFAALLGHPSSRPGPGAAETEAVRSEPASAHQHTQAIAETIEASTVVNAREESAAMHNADALDAGSSASSEPSAQRIIVRSGSPLVQRAVPLTRLPLRPQENEITWTRELAALGFDRDPSRTQRHALLERSVREADTLPGPVLVRAYREEDLEGRTIALRALTRHYPAEGKALFVEALRLGSDDERALAIDGLTNAEARAELVPGFGDRVDAVAAKAALAYVGSRSRIEYRAELAPYIDAAQVEKILTMLAGIIE